MANLFYGRIALCKSIVALFGFLHNVEKSSTIAPTEIRPVAQVVSLVSGYKYRLALQKMQIHALLAMDRPNCAKQPL